MENNIEVNKKELIERYDKLSALINESDRVINSVAKITIFTLLPPIITIPATIIIKLSKNKAEKVAIKAYEELIVKQNELIRLRQKEVEEQNIVIQSLSNENSVKDIRIEELNAIIHKIELFRFDIEKTNA